MTTITLPHNWTPRPYQMEVFEAFRKGIKRAVLVWHRQSGKDDFALHYTACAATQRVGNYWHMLPQANQCRKVVWDALNPNTGKRRIDEAFPPEIREFTRSQDMVIKFKNGSVWQLVGSDNFDALVGSTPVGLVFSEFALADPLAWTYLRPILAANGGYAMMISTPRGKNHLYNLFNMAKGDPDWFASKVTATESGVMSQATLDRELREMIAERGPEEGKAKFNQEYMCEFDEMVSGSFYGSILDQLESDGQITSVPHDPALPVVTSWDLGMKDPTNVWFFQHLGMQIRVIDCYATTGEGVDAYARMLTGKKYNYEQHIMPHDVRVREIGTGGKTRYEMLQSLGVHPITVAKRIPLYDGINAVRATLPRMWFDRKKCAAGLEALRFYHKEWDDVMKRFRDHPEKDWSNHFCFPAGTRVRLVRGVVPIEDVVVGDTVVLPTGELGLVEVAGQTGTATELLKLTLENGAVLQCTPQHKLFTVAGIDSADTLGYDAHVISEGGLLWRNEWWCTKVESIIGTPMGTTQRAQVAKPIRRICTALFGKLRMGLFPKGLLSTILITTPVTTNSVTYNSWPLRIIDGTMENVVLGLDHPKISKLWRKPENFPTSLEELPKSERKPLRIGSGTPNYKSGSGLRGLRQRWLERRKPRKSGTEAWKDAHGIEKMGNVSGKSEYGLRWFVWSAVRNFLLRSQVVRSSAVRVVKREHVTVDCIPVYNLTVEKHNCFVAEGVLVSNCDSLRAYCVGYTKPVRMKSVTETLANRSFQGVW